MTEPSQPDDLKELGETSGYEDSADDGLSSKNVAELERRLEEANTRLRHQNAERMIYALSVIIFLDIDVFQRFSNWAPTVAILILELIGVFIIAYRLDMKEVVTLMWATMRTYGKNDPGDPP